MSVHVIVLPGGGYEVHAEHEAQPVQTEIRRLRDKGASTSFPTAPTAWALPVGLASTWTCFAESWIGEQSENVPL